MAEITQIRGVPVEVIAGKIEEIEREDGVCHPSRLVEKARPKRSVLHPLFEWDDTEAARQWRTHQARRVINSIPLEVGGGTESPPRYVSVRKITPDGVAEGYMSTTRALSSDTRDGVIADALALLRGVRARYRNINELAAVWDAVDEVDREVAA